MQPVTVVAAWTPGMPTWQANTLIVVGGYGLASQYATHNELRNIFQSAILFVGAPTLLLLVGWLIAGAEGLGPATASIMLLAVGQRLSPQTMRRKDRTRRFTLARPPLSASDRNANEHM
jgi:hypothetical protein